MKPATRLALRAFALTAAAVVVGCLYFFIRQYFKDGVWLFDWTLVNKSLGTAALFMAALSMFLTGVAYFSNGSAKPLAFRKHYGLAGFWTGLVHGAVNHFLLPAAGLEAEEHAAALLSDATGIAGLVLFAIMALLSNTTARKRVGGESWRRVLRYTGYAGLVLGAGHAAVLKWASWTKYFRTLDSVLPSLSLPVAAFAAAVIILRLAVWVAQKKRRA